MRCIRSKSPYKYDIAGEKETVLRNFMALTLAKKTSGISHKSIIVTSIANYEPETYCSIPKG